MYLCLGYMWSHWLITTLEFTFKKLCWQPLILPINEACSNKILCHDWCNWSHSKVSVTAFLPQEQQSVYAVIQHSTNPPAAPPPTELQPVVYAAVKQSTNSSDAPLSSEYDDIGYHVEMMEEAVQETCPTSCKGQCLHQHGVMFHVPSANRG